MGRCSGGCILWQLFHYSRLKTGNTLLLIMTRSSYMHASLSWFSTCITPSVPLSLHVLYKWWRRKKTRAAWCSFDYYLTITVGGEQYKHKYKSSAQTNDSAGASANEPEEVQIIDKARRKENVVLAPYPHNVQSPDQTSEWRGAFHYHIGR